MAKIILSTNGNSVSNGSLIKHKYKLRLPSTISKQTPNFLTSVMLVCFSALAQIENVDRCAVFPELHSMLGTHRSVPRVGLAYINF